MTDKLIWRKSSYSGGQGGDCVEVGQDSGAVLVRDTKARESGHLAVDASTWKKFTDGIKHGQAAVLVPQRETPRRP